MAGLDCIAVSEREEERFLSALADPARAPIAARHLGIVVAHPDDETIGCGAQLHRLRDATLVVVSDGAPRDLSEARTHGFPTTVDYAQARSKELRKVCALAGICAENVVRLAIPDQTLGFRLADLARRLENLFQLRDIRIALTHAYEGGHPDHDATAFAVHAASALLRRRGKQFSIVEMPLYHMGRSGTVPQRFVSHAASHEVTVRLGDDAQRSKQGMLAAYVSQERTLAFFSTEAERFRCAPAYDFSTLPNGGRLLYEHHNWGMTGERWLALARAALRELRLGDHQWL
jgi:LmbE family N-acetylglucosaminyl deacetylase